MSLLLKHARHLNIRHFSRCATLIQRVYSSQEKEFILNKINEQDLPSNKGLNSNHITKIYQHVEKQKLNSLEELLNLKGIGPKVLRKICDAVLNIDTSSEEPTNKKRLQNIITPSLDDLQKKELVLITAIHIGVGSISWALINSLNKCLLEWDFREYFQEKGSLYSSLILAENIISSIPTGDIYVLEETPSGRNPVDHNRNLMTAVLSSFIEATRQKDIGSSVVAFLKPIVKNKIYNASVGSERISLQNHVVSIINETSQTDCVTFPKDLKEKYFVMNPSTKEDMAQAFLLATAFINIVLNKRPLKF